MLEGDLRGYPQHGSDRIFQILEGIENGTLFLKSKPKILKKSASVETWDGLCGLGQVIGHQAMSKSIKLAQKTGIGLVGVINAGHLGVLSYYSELAAKNSCLGIVLTTSSPAVVLNSGTTKTLGTNPICFSIPHAPFPITGDFATSKVSRGRVVDAFKKKEPIPQDWAVDENGNPTIDPKRALAGGLRIFDDGHKGTCISFLISILAGPLIGGVSNDLVKGTRDMSSPPNKGDVFLAIDISQTTSLDYFDAQIGHFVEFIQNQESNFRIPGKIEHACLEDALKHGIFVSERLNLLLKE